MLTPDLPGPDIQFTPVDDAGELKEYWEPPTHPHTVLRRYIHVVTGVILKGLQKNNGYAHRYGLRSVKHSAMGYLSTKTVHKEQPDGDLRPLGDVFGAVTDEADGLHAGVWERGIAGELRQTLDGVLEGVDCGCKVLFEYIRWQEKWRRLRNKTRREV